MKIKEDFQKMTVYEQWKLKLDFLRFLVAFIGLIVGPLVTVILWRVAKVYWGW